MLGAIGTIYGMVFKAVLVGAAFVLLFTPIWFIGILMFGILFLWIRSYR